MGTLRRLATNSLSCKAGRSMRRGATRPGSRSGALLVEAVDHGFEMDQRESQVLGSQIRFVRVTVHQRFDDRP